MDKNDTFTTESPGPSFTRTYSVEESRTSIGLNNGFLMTGNDEVLLSSDDDDFYDTYDSLDRNVEIQTDQLIESDLGYNSSHSLGESTESTSFISLWDKKNYSESSESNILNSINPDSLNDLKEGEDENDVPLSKLIKDMLDNILRKGTSSTEECISEVNNNIPVQTLPEHNESSTSLANEVLKKELTTILEGTDEFASSVEIHNSCDWLKKFTNEATSFTAHSHETTCNIDEETFDIHDTNDESGMSNDTQSMNVEDNIIYLSRQQHDIYSTEKVFSNVSSNYEECCSFLSMNSPDSENKSHLPLNSKRFSSVSSFLSAVGLNDVEVINTSEIQGSCNVTDNASMDENQNEMKSSKSGSRRSGREEKSFLLSETKIKDSECNDSEWKNANLHQETYISVTPIKSVKELKIIFTNLENRHQMASKSVSITPAGKLRQHNKPMIFITPMTPN